MNLCSCVSVIFYVHSHCRLSQAVTHVPGVMVPSRYLQDSAVFVRQLLAIYAWCYRTLFDTNVFTLSAMK